MRKIVVFICCYLILSLLVVIAPQLAIAQPQAVGQGQSSGARSATPSPSQDIAARIRGLSDEIKGVQQAIQDMEKVIRQLLDDLKQLRAARPVPPKGNTPQEKDAYSKHTAEWQYKVTAKENEVYIAHVKLDQLHRQLGNLQERLANLQKESGDTSEKKLQPVKVTPRKR